jgi:hypothetical protein
MFIFQEMIIGLIAFSIICAFIPLVIRLEYHCFAFLWGIHEIIEQEEQVRKGWFPRSKKLRKDA